MVDETCEAEGVAHLVKEHIKQIVEVLVGFLVLLEVNADLSIERVIRIRSTPVVRCSYTWPP